MVLWPVELKLIQILLKSMTNDQKETILKRIRMSNLTEEQIEELAIKSLQNYGTPEKFLCRECGCWYNNPEFFDHPCVKELENK
jgi:rubrerythrin